MTTATAIIATTPSQMQEAHSTTKVWVDRKIAQAHAEIADAQRVCDAVVAARLKVSSTVLSQMRRANRRLRFYEKVKAALDAGYYIIPPFDVQIFAVRTDKACVSPDRDSTKWGNDVSAQQLPIGEGRYVSPVPKRMQVDTEERTHKDGSKYSVALYENRSFRDVELPVRAYKPEIIEATGAALEQRIFDTLGIAPMYRSADPIIVGQITRPGGGVLTFFVAWWLDAKDL